MWIRYNFDICDINFWDLYAECRCGAITVLEKIISHKKENELMSFLINHYGHNYPRMCDINDYLIYNQYSILENLGIN